MQAMDATSEHSKSWRAFRVASLAVSTLCIVAWLLKLANYGFDFSDEGYYLVWMSNPFDYDWSTTQFGFIYHPFFLLLDGNVARLRQSNILAIFFLSWLLIDILLKKASPEFVTASLQRLVLSSGFAVVSMVYFAPWIPTPSYNSLGLQAMLITATGVLLAEPTRELKSVCGWVMIGVGGWLAFMAKPPLAAALGGGVFVYLVVSRKIDLLLIGLSITTSAVLLIVSAFIIDGALSGFFERLRTGGTYSALAGAGYSIADIFRVDRFSLSRFDILVFGAVTVVSLISAYLVTFRQSAFKSFGVLFSVALLAFNLVGVFGLKALNVGGGGFQGLIVLSIPAAAILLCLVVRQVKLSLDQCALSLLFIIFPHVFAFGTNGNYWQVGSYAGIFWVVSGLVLIAPNISSNGLRAALFPLALAAQAVTVMLVQAGAENPYRQTQPLRLSTEAIDVGSPGSSLLLSEGYAGYIAKSIASADSAGFEPGTAVLDLTGQSPGLLFAMRAVSVGYPWVAGGYPGSLEVAKLGLMHVTCDKLASAWLLMEPGGPRALSSDLLMTFGSALPEDYQVVANWDTAEGAGGYQAARHQQLLRPVRSERAAKQSCEKIRAGI